MKLRRRGGESNTAEPEEDILIDLRERLEPYEFDGVGNPDWRDALVAADQRRRERPLRIAR